MPCARATASCRMSATVRAAPSSTRGARRSGLLQQSVEETIVPRVRENLTFDVPDLWTVRDVEQRQQLRLRVRSQERGYLQLIFGREDRASCVQQFTTCSK